jgi:hypothetical protein
MKTLLGIVIFIIWLPFCNAQVLVRESKLWSNLEYGTERPEDQNYHSYWIKFEGDSLVHDTLYKKVSRSDDSLHINWISYGFMREDSFKRVYALDVPRVNYTSNEELIYDFNLEKDDSINSYDVRYLHVDSVSHIYIANKSYKVIYLPYNTKWIEGIGSLGGILHGLNDIGFVGQANSLVCFSENDSLIYHNNNYNFCFIHHFPFGYNQILKIHDVFDFQVGDEFHSKTTTNGGGLPNADRITVIEKTFSAHNDSITYTYHHDRYSVS